MQAVAAMGSPWGYAGVFLHNLISSFCWAWLDIKCRYRRSLIGPLWETLNVFVITIGISYVSGAVFNTSPLSSLPYIGLGMIVWSTILTIVNEGTSCFIQHKDLIKNSTLDMNVYIGRMVFRIFIIAAHHMSLYFVGVLFLPIPLGMTSLLALVGFFFLLVNAFWVMPVLGLLCARFRDLDMVVRSLVQLVFFVTPIFWDYRTIASNRTFIVDYNPVFYLLEIIRAPLLGEIPPLSYYLIPLGTTLAGYALLFVVYKKFGRYLAFYV